MAPVSNVNDGGRNRLRVGMLGCLPPLRGISSYCLELAASVSRLADVEFISFQSMYPRFLYPGGGLRDDTTFPDFETPTLKVRRVLNWYNPLGWLLAAARIKADIVHVQHWSPALVPVYLVFLAVLRMRAVKTVITIHNVLPHDKGWFYVRATRMLCRLAHECIVHSDDNRRQAVAAMRLPESGVTCIGHGVLALFNDGKSNRETARERLNLARDVPVVLCFGAIRPYKGLDVLIRSFARTLKQVPDAVLVIAGKAWVDWKPYQELVEDAGIGSNVNVFPDYVPAADVKTYFLAADLLVLPYTRFEAQSGVGLTGLAFAKPMVVTRVGGLPELVRNPACVVHPNDELSLADAMSAILTDEPLRGELAAEALDLAGSFSWDNIARQTVSTYERICRK